MEFPHGDGYQSGICVGGKPHNWQPVSFVFETQILDQQGRTVVRQPAIQKGRVYCVCMACLHHTYVETDWVGFYLGGPDRGDEGGAVS